jgi:hypothetical protein
MHSPHSSPPPSRHINTKGVRASGIGRDTCHRMVNSDPPPPIPLTTPGGSEQTTLPLQNPPPPPNSQNHFFASFTSSSSEIDSGKMETNFQNPREVFVQHGMKNKNLSQNLHRCQELGESNHL